jgi:hypothetical protein
VCVRACVCVCARARARVLHDCVLVACAGGHEHGCGACEIPKLASGIAVSRDSAYLTSLEVKLPNFFKSHSEHGIFGHQIRKSLSKSLVLYNDFAIHVILLEYGNFESHCLIHALRPVSQATASFRTV